MTERLGTAEALAASRASSVKRCYLIELDFSSGFVRVNDSDRDIVFGGNVFLGIGKLGKISDIKETTAVRVDSVTLQLSGVDPANISTALNEHYQGRPGNIWMAFFDENDVMIVDPVLTFSGVIDTMDIEIGQQAIIEVIVQNRFAKWETFPVPRRFNDEDQRLYYPDDRGFQYVEQMIEKDIKWGRG